MVGLGDGRMNGAQAFQALLEPFREAVVRLYLGNKEGIATELRLILRVKRLSI
jgi:hypothetical protein